MLALGKVQFSSQTFYLLFTSFLMSYFYYIKQTPLILNLLDIIHTFALVFISKLIVYMYGDDIELLDIIL